jgi:large subunit ribosomal protein L29
MKMSEIKEMPPVELQVKGGELRQELFSLNLQKSIGTLEKSHRIGQLRKDIARVETALNAKRKSVLNSGIGVTSGDSGEVSESK